MFEIMEMKIMKEKFSKVCNRSCCKNGCLVHLMQVEETMSYRKIECGCVRIYLFTHLYV